MTNNLNEDELNSIYQYLLGRYPDGSGKKHYMKFNGDVSDIFKDITQSKEYKDLFFNKKEFSDSINGQIMVFSGGEINKYYSKLEDIVFKKNYLLAGETYKKTSHEIFNGVQDDDSISYKMNLDGHRSDNFTKDHKGLHILFAGCSFTFGEGLPNKENWSGRLYKKILKDFKISGYYNLSYLGGSIDIIINNIYNYINRYGVPDYIFILFPEVKRKYKYNGGIFYSDIPGQEEKYSNYGSMENSIYQNFSLIKNLEIFLNHTNCKMLWTTWNDEDAKIFNNMPFDNYIYCLEYDIISKADNYKEVKNKYFYRSRDGWHPGLIYSDGLSNMFMEKINEKNLLQN
jgi:hypothetical protein